MKQTYIGIVFILSFFFISFKQANAQQVGMYNHYFYKPMVYNPAFTGDSDAVNILIIHHSQWAGFKGAPQHNTFMVDKGFMNKKMGLGLGLVSDKKGINNRIAGNLFYSYRIHINGHTNLSFGLSFGVINQTLDYSKALVENTADATLFANSQQKTTYDGNAGLAFICKGLEFGVAAPHLLENKIKYADSSNYTQTRHYMSSLKYKFYVSKDKGVSIAPQGLVRFVPNAPLQYDGTLNVDWNNKFWFGATYKSDYAVAAHVGFCIHKLFSVGYSYDIITGSIGKYSGLSHEIMLNIKFGKSKKTEEKPVEEEPEAEIPEPEPAAEEPPKEETKTAVVEITPPPVETKPAFDAEADRRRKLDSLEQIRLKEEQDRIKNQQVKAPEPVTTKINSGVWIGTNKAREFKDPGNQFPEKGYYVVVRSFHNRDFALAEIKRLLQEGFKTTDWIYSESTDFNYVFIKKVYTKDEALKHAINAKVAGYEDVWIQRLIE